MIYKPGNHTAPAWLDKQSSDVKKELSDPTAYGDGEFCPKLKVQLVELH